jgi:hypothetical protein
VSVRRRIEELASKEQAPAGVEVNMVAATTASPILGTGPEEPCYLNGFHRFGFAFLRYLSSTLNS